ncbi:hypothetical protein GALMADRAFT_222390 [Galerina marginata CBS 339.88]|uniref:BIR-domain-containing protein n=1 Tax=Galerina marginata (strain CBS 339.88) TaxID=685588 RepID=A0A067TC99_GALM3|nr:hypothetical protein GALMADRAFT_222390 [Galerina marginata CBS 339.88]
MESLQARVNSFKKSKRVKNPTKTSATTSLKWPHPPEFRANPETLAEAGFYYDPSYDDPDNVTCYVCEKALGGWEEDDDPFLIHWRKCGQTCCWASVRCGLLSDMDGMGRFVSSDKARIPAHKAMETARLETYSAGKGWIHDKTTNHGASSKMMARAGFVYTPQHSGDDLATCYYCNTSLSGWDAEDDPLEEHRKRESKGGMKCAFFAVSSSEVTSSAKPASRTQPAKSQSKPPSRSASRSKHQDAIMPTKTFDGEIDGDSDAAPPANPAQSTAKTPRKARSTSASSTKKPSAKTPRSKTRSSSRSGLKNVAEEEEEEAVPEPQPPVEKKSRSRSKSVARSEIPEDIETDDDEHVAHKPSRSRSKKVISELEEDIPRKSSRSKAKASVAPATNEDEVARKPPRAKSKAKAAVESEQEEPPQITAKPKHKRTASKSKSKAPVQVSDVESDLVPEPEIATVAPKKKASSKSKPPQTPAPENLFDDVFLDSRNPPPSHLTPASKQTSTVELLPLFIPKRTTTKKTPTPSEDLEDAPPVEKEKRKPGRPKTKPQPRPQAEASEEEADASERPPSTDPYKPLASISINPPSQPPAKEKPAGKSKFTLSKPDAPTTQKMKVVEISSDEEPEHDEVKPTKVVVKQEERPRNSKTSHSIQPASQARSAHSESHSRLTSTQGKRQKKSIVVETVQPFRPPRTPSPPGSPFINPDISMEFAKPNEDTKMNEDPVTPPRPVAQIPPSSKEAEPVETTERNSSSAEPLFIPALSKLPFTPLQALSEAELDMTVEEWIRYQMEVEYDKFRRDGERELQRFRKRAEEVRKVIEGL